MPEKVLIEKINIQPDFITRDQEVNPDTVARYRLVLDQLPPLTLWRHPETGGLILLDGRNRLEAHQAEGSVAVDAVFFEGSYEDAKVRARASNASHGLAYTRAEWQKVIREILSIRCERTNAWIAREAQCSSTTIARVRAEMEAAGQIPVMEELVGENGQRYSRSSGQQGGDAVEEGQTEEVADSPARPNVALDEDEEEPEAEAAGRTGDESGETDERPPVGEKPPREANRPTRIKLQLAQLGEPLLIEIGLYIGEGQPPAPCLATLLIGEKPPKGLEEAAPGLENENCLIIHRSLAESLNLLIE